MRYNDNYPSDIVPLLPRGTNSTFFTGCCQVAICDDEANCPHCGRPVVGFNVASGAARNRVRWDNATRFWNRP